MGKLNIVNNFTSGFDVVTVEKPYFKKHYITAHLEGNGKDSEMFEKVSSFVRNENAQILTQDIFASCQLYESGIQKLRSTCGELKWPVTWIDGNTYSEENIAATQLCAISDFHVEPIVFDGHILGSVYEDKDAKYCYLGALHSSNLTLPQTVQARTTFAKIEAVLRKIGMDFSNVVRTWFYINDILSWYDDFNEVRTSYFSEKGVFDNLIPASTGIGVGNSAGAALIAEVFAMKIKNDNINIQPIPSPLQCPAIDYESSFSRAVEIDFSDYRIVLISGTASIDPDGRTAYVGDVQKQIDCTMEVVQAILKSRNMNWENTSRAVAYFKEVKDIPLFHEYCKQKNLPPLPIAITYGEICRDDLLFEIEVDAIK